MKMLKKISELEIQTFQTNLFLMINEMISIFRNMNFHYKPSHKLQTQTRNFYEEQNDL